MSILIIGVGNVGAGIADKINEMKMPGVNCAVVVDCVASMLILISPKWLILLMGSKTIPLIKLF